MLYRQLKDQTVMSYVIDGLAEIAAGRGKWNRAACLCGAVAALRPANRNDFLFDQRRHERTVVIVRTQLNEATFATMWAEGQAMTLEQAIAYALELSTIDAELPAPTVATAK